MRLIDADELIEHAWRDKLDSRELIAGMIDNAPTVKEISIKIPINVFERLISQQPKTGHWIRWYETIKQVNCTIHDPHCKCSECDQEYDPYNASLFNYCPNCGVKMESEE